MTQKGKSLVIRTITSQKIPPHYIGDRIVYNGVEYFVTESINKLTWTISGHYDPSLQYWTTVAECRDA